MKFIDLTWKKHFIPGTIHAVHDYGDGWEVSIVSGPKGCGLHGDIAKGLYEVLVSLPDGKDLDVIGYINSDQINKIFETIEYIRSNANCGSIQNTLYEMSGVNNVKHLPVS